MGEITLEELAEGMVLDYQLNERRSLDRLELSIQHLTRFFGAGRPASELTTDEATRYILHRRGEGVANQTIKNELSALRRMFTLAHRAGRVEKIPYIPRPKVNNVREGFLQEGDLRAILAQLVPDLRPVVRFAALTGWRKREILRLQWKSVDWSHRVVRLAPGTTKNGDGREFPFGPFPPLRALLERQRELTTAAERKRQSIIPHVFHRGGRPILSMRKAWEGACKRAGFEGAWFHDLRRTAVRNLERAGVPRSVAMKLTGHKTESVYLRYAIADRSALEEGVQKLARLHGTIEREVDQTVIPLFG